MYTFSMWWQGSVYGRPDANMSLLKNETFQEKIRAWILNWSQINCRALWIFLNFTLLSNQPPRKIPLGIRTKLYNRSCFAFYFQNFTSLYLSMDSREDMDSWLECLTHALKRPSSTAKEQLGVMSQGACAGKYTFSGFSCTRVSVKLSIPQVYLYQLPCYWLYRIDN